MPERWEKELSKLATLDPPAHVRSRIDEGPHGDRVPPMPGRGQRIAAGVVAFAVFAGAAVFAMAAFREGEPSDVGDPETAVLTLTAGMKPEASLTFGGESAVPVVDSYCWNQPNGPQACVDVVPPEPFRPGEFLQVPAGTPFTIVNDDGADPVALTLATGDDPTVLGFPTSKDALQVTDPGRYVLTVSADWEQGGQPIAFHFPLEITPRGDDVLLAMLDAPDDGSVPTLQLTNQRATRSIHPQGGEWSGGPVGWDLVFQSFPVELPLGTRIAFDGDAEDVSATIRYGVPQDSVTEPLERGLAELPTVPGLYVIEVTATWPQGTVEFTFGVRLRDPEALTVTWEDWVHAAFGEQDVELTEIPGGDPLAVDLTGLDLETLELPEGTQMWVVSETDTLAAWLQDERGSKSPFSSRDFPRPIAVYERAPGGDFFLIVEGSQAGQVKAYALRLHVVPSSVGTPTDPVPPPTDEPTGSLEPPPLPVDVVVPDLAGLTEQEAMRALADVGLEGVVSYGFIDGVDLGYAGGWSSPSAGTTVTEGTAVEFDVDVPGEAPSSGGGYVFIERFQRAYPGVLFGGRQGPDGNPVAVFEPGYDPQEWRDELDSFINVPSYSVAVCPVSSAELEAVAREILRRSEAGELDSKGHAFGVSAETCSVHLEGEFPPETIASLQAEFGDLITIFDGIRMSLARA